MTIHVQHLQDVAKNTIDSMKEQEKLFVAHAEARFRVQEQENQNMREEVAAAREDKAKLEKQYYASLNVTPQPVDMDTSEPIGQTEGGGSTSSAELCVQSSRVCAHRCYQQRFQTQDVRCEIIILSAVRCQPMLRVPKEGVEVMPALLFRLL